MKVYYEDDVVKLSYIDSNSCAKKRFGRVCICFTGVGFSLGGLEVQREEFKKLNKFDFLVFVTDKKRSWGNALDIDFIVSMLRPFVFDRKVFVLGNSMGGFLAVMFARRLKATVCVAFSPQYSIDPSLVKDRRWQSYRSQIHSIRFRSIDIFFDKSIRYYLFFGDELNEREHYVNLLDCPASWVFVLFNQGHNLVKELKEKGVLYGLVYKCFSGVKRDLISNFLVEEGFHVLCSE